MKIFIDTADINEIREANKIGIIDGVTTNPTLIARTGRKFEEVVRDIVSEVDGPISVEVVSLDSNGMVEEARKLAGIHKNITMKIPMTTEGLKAVKILSKEGIKTNVTLIFSTIQALLAAKAGATFVSPFVGRLDDISQDGFELVEQIVEIYNNYDFETEIIAASVRNPVHVIRAALCGCHIATIPYSTLMQLAKHPLTDAGIKKFLEDWQKVPR
ncbi:MAG: fructose-6-phosphate aldolase [Deltaproteobacteria bacterium]|nr:fructose-6-phosphate aldolase [Deltaproteobacteria bacterium]